MGLCKIEGDLYFSIYLMYDPNAARKKQLEMTKKAEKELEHVFDKYGFNFRWIHKNGTQKDENWNNKEYYQIMENYEELFRTWKIHKENTKITEVKNERFTGCYNCYKSISNVYMIECSKCWWIICSSCGSCGCGYGKKEEIKSE